jgi:hypothetical protein
MNVRQTNSVWSWHDPEGAIGIIIKVKPIMVYRRLRFFMTGTVFDRIECRRTEK